MPVHPGGPFSAIGHRIDVAGLVEEVARRKHEDEAEEAGAGAHERLVDKLGGRPGK